MPGPDRSAPPTDAHHFLTFRRIAHDGGWFDDTAHRYCRSMFSDESDIRVLRLEADGDPISTPDDASDLVGAAWSHQANLVTVPVERLDPEFFRLSTGIAGEIMQKLVNYRLRLAVIGDISEQLAASNALRDFVWESNRGDQIWFLADEQALDEKLALRAARSA